MITYRSNGGNAPSRLPQATLDYLAEGNDQLTAFKKGTNVFAPKQRENNVRFIIMNYFREQAAQGMCVESKVEGRIVIK